MIAIWPGLVEASERKGWDDGSHHRKFAPLMTEGTCPDADDAYSFSFWIAFFWTPPS